MIGDVHGYADELEALLRKLGYCKIDGVYQQPGHQVIFLGDFIDRGEQQREVLNIVRPMIDGGFARSVMGNHEFNAICYATKASDGSYLREHSKKNYDQHKKFLNAYPDEAERQEVIAWFKTLPIFIDADDFRVIHACWNQSALEDIRELLNDQHCLLDEAYPICSERGSKGYCAVELLLKGPEVALPEGVGFKDKDGTVRKEARIKWWVARDKINRERLALGDGVTEAHRIENELEIDAAHHYPADHCPVFIGHYWLNHESPAPLADNCACLDYSVAKQGKLVAYRWQGERTLTQLHFIW